jgi:hypothetical protein
MQDRGAIRARVEWIIWGDRLFGNSEGEVNFVVLVWGAISHLLIVMRSSITKIAHPRLRIETSKNQWGFSALAANTGTVRMMQLHEGAAQAA